MERGEGFRRRREIEREIDDYHYPDCEQRRSKFVESAEKSGDSPEKRLSETIAKIKVREILNDLERQEYKSIRDLTDEDRTEILQSAREHSL